MASSGLPSFWLRTTPVNVATAPMSVRPAVRALTSAPTSKSSRWTRTHTSASRHRRKERDLAGAGEARLRRHVLLVDGGADDVAAGEGFRVFRPPALEPIDEPGPGPPPGRQLDHLLGLARLLAHPGEIEDLQLFRLHGGHPALARPIDRWRCGRRPSNSRGRSTASKGPPSTAGRSRQW